MAEIVSGLILLQSFALIISWILFAIAAGVAAYCRGRDVAGFLILGIFTGFFALIFVLIAPPNTAELEKRAIEKGHKKRCETCKELVHVEARKCPHCTTPLTLPNQSPKEEAK